MKPVNVSAGSAGKYYYEKDPIFNEDGKGSNLEVQGVLSETLGLKNGESLSREEFNNIINGKTKEGVSLIEKDRTRACVDLVFSAPKSFSHAALVLDNKELIDVHKQAVTDALDFIEKNYAMTRTYENGERVNTKTNNIGVIKVLHSTARPVNGEAPDPSLHTHSLILNETYHNGKIMSLSNDAIFKNQKLIQQVYQNSLAKYAEEKGYVTEKKQNGTIELSGYDKKDLEVFSSRHKEINEAKNELSSLKNLSEGRMDMIAQHTSKSEKIDITKENLVNAWKDKHENFCSTSLNELRESLKNQTVDKWNYSVKDTLKISAENIIKNEEVFSKEQLIKEALVVSRGKYTYQDFEKDINSIKKTGQKEDSDIKKVGEGFYTIKEIYDKRLEIYNTLKDSNKSTGSFLNESVAKEGLEAFKQFKAKELGVEKISMTKGQEETILKTLTTDKQFIIADGVPGAGKSFSMEAIKFINDWSEKEGKTNEQNNLLNKIAITALSTSGKASSGLKNSTGIETTTIDSNLLKNSIQNIEQNNLKILNNFHEISESHVSTKHKNSNEDIFSDKKNQIGGGILGFTHNSRVSRNNYSLFGTKNSYKKETITKGEFKNSVQVKKTSVSKNKVQSFVENKFNDGRTVSRHVVTQYQPTFSTLISRGIEDLLLSDSRMSNNVFDRALASFLTSPHKSENFNKRVDSIEKETKVGSERVIETKEFVKSSSRVIEQKINSKFQYGDNKTLQVKENIKIEQQKNGNGRRISEKELQFDKDGKQVSKIENEIKNQKVVQNSGVTKNFDKEGNLVGSSVFKETVSASNSNKMIGYIVSLNGGTISSSNYERNISSNEVKINDTKVITTYAKEEVQKITKILEKDIHSIDNLQRKQLVINDESSMNQTRHFHALLKNNPNSKFLFVGDIQQILPVGQGNVFSETVNDILSKDSELKNNVAFVRLEETQRQKTEEAKAPVSNFINKDFSAGFSKLHEQGRVFDIKNFQERVDKSVELFMKSENQGKNVAIIAATLKETDYINQSVREAKFGSHDFGQKFNVVSKVNFSEKDKRIADSYSVDKNMLRIYNEGKATDYNIISKDINSNKLHISDKNGNSFDYDLKTSNTSNLQVLEKKEINLSVNDKVMFGNNDKNLNVYNGESGRIEKINGSVISVRHENNSLVNIDTNSYKDINYGYSFTPEKSQGATLSSTINLINFKSENIENKFTKQSLEISNTEKTLNKAYVQLTRHTHDVYIVSDNSKKLENLQSQFKTSVMDFKNEAQGTEKYNERFNGFNKGGGHESIKESNVNIKDKINLSDKKSGIVDINSVKESSENFKQARDNNQLDTKEGRSSQKGFMDSQAVIRNGVSFEKIEQFVKHSVKSGSLSEQNGKNFINSSMQNAKNLEKIGILETKNGSEFTFRDEKSREILSKNLGQSYEKISQEVLKIYSKSSEKSENKESDKSSEKSESKESEKSSDKSENKESDKSSEKSENKESDKSSEKSENKESDKSSEKSESKESEKSSDKSENKESEKSSEKSENKESEKSSEKSENKESEKSSDKSENKESKSSEKSENKESEKSSEKSENKESEKSSEKSENKESEKSSEKSESKESEKSSDKSENKESKSSEKSENKESEKSSEKSENKESEKSSDKSENKEFKSNSFLAGLEVGIKNGENSNSKQNENSSSQSNSNQNENSNSKQNENSSSQSNSNQNENSNSKQNENSSSQSNSNKNENSNSNQKQSSSQQQTPPQNKGVISR